MDINTEVVIVGGGPSGCMAANILIDAGKRVLLIDKHKFPRHKSCAGGLTPKTLSELPFDVQHLCQHNSKKMLFQFTNGKTVDLNNELGACKMVVREDFDNYFFNYVKEKGVKFLNSKVLNIYEDKDEVTIETDDTVIKSNYLIGADGANSTTRRLITDLKFENPVFAFEGLVDKKNCNQTVPTKFVFNKLGYSWIFPKRDHYNVGVGNLVFDKSYPKPKKNDLYTFVKEQLGTEIIEHITGFPIGTEGQSYEPKSKRMYLIGDAAGLAETLLGEGIYNAVISGKYIANAIKDAHSPDEVYNTYKKFLDGMKKELALYNRGSKILYKKQKISYWMLKLFFGKKFMDGYSTGKTLTEIVKGKYPFPST